jgi:hypothetical protein
MPDIFYLLGKWWKQIIIVVGLSTITAGAIVFSMPRKYLSTTTALPANSILSDKASIFNENIQQLYSSLGGSDDLDRMIGTAQLDTLYISVTNAFNLWDHYKIAGDKSDLSYRTAAVLRKNSRIMKSEYGELKVKVWDTDKELAPQLANALTKELNFLHSSLQSESNQYRLNGLTAGREKLRASMDSVANNNAAAAQMAQYDKLIGEYELMVATNPAAILIVEKARPSLFPDKPRRAMIIAGTALLSFLFAVVLALLLERRKRSLS